MAIISSFLCWSNTRTGSAVCGYYTLVVSVLCLAFYMLRYIALDEIKDSIELKGIVYAGFVLYSFLIGVSLVLLPGVYMDRKFLLLPWIYVLVITVLYETGAIALVTTVHLEQDHTLSPWEVVAVVFYCLRLVANCYCFACVVSQYQELSEGRGTYEFLFKPRRRHMARGAPVSDLEEYHPPYGASLPPYSKVNLYKEYSPPNYENLGMETEDRRWDIQHLSPLGLRGAASTSCLAEVHVSSTPPPEFDDVENVGDDHNDPPLPSSSVGHRHNHHQSNNHQQHPSQQDHRRHHHHRHQHHRHRSLPVSNHPSDFNLSVDDNNRTVELINHSRHRSAGSKPTTSVPFEGRLPDSWNDLHLQRLHNHAMDPEQDGTACQSGNSTNLNNLEHSLAKEPITMTDSSGFLTFSQTDFRTPTPKSSPASVHSCHRFNTNRSSPAIQKRTYITWI